MKSLTQLYKIGFGPSSSHTMGPSKIALEILSRHPDANFKVTLYGSLALTGRGHGTDVVIKRVLGENTIVEFNTEKKDLPHPNTLDITVNEGEKEVITYTALSVGGGDIKILGLDNIEPPEVYSLNTFEEIKKYCENKQIRICDYVFETEPVKDFLHEVWEQMKLTIREGLAAEGVLPGGLNVQRKAKFLLSQKHIDESPETRENRIVCACAFAVAEQNASYGKVVTAPTCGSAGVVPSVLYYMQKKHGFSDDQIVNALATAGIIGNIIKTNASISGAECGCQAEIGSACSMASAALAELFEMDIDQIEYAAELSMEHHLGLTCDPIMGLVQIPCIERNAVAAMRALNALSLANFLTYTRKISFDLIVKTMYETGKDLSTAYRETSEGGMAKLYK